MNIARSAAGERDRMLDAWRGISILMVILHHAIYFRFADIFRAFLEVPVSGTMMHVLFRADYILVEFSERAGPLGVKIFFVISGYIITRLLLEEEFRTKTIDIWAFYFRRVIRILPALIVYVASATVFALLGWVAYDPISFFASLGFMCNTSYIACTQTTIHTWTLSVEEQFYIVWPLAFMFIGARWRTAFLVASLIVLSSCIMLGLFVAHGWINNPQAFACIAFGALYATNSWWKHFVDRWGFITTVLLALCVGLLHWIGLEEVARKLYWTATPFALLSLVMTSYRVERWIPRLLLNGFATLGLFSYSLYLWQEIFLMEEVHYLTPSVLQWTALLIPITLASFYIVERPIIRWGRRVTRARLSGVTSASAQ